MILAQLNKAGVVGLAPDTGERQHCRSTRITQPPFEGKNVLVNLMVKP